MANANPYHLFGGKARKGGLSDYVSSHTSVEECLQRTVDLKLSWWDIAVSWDDGLHCVQKSDDKPPKNEPRDAE